jgi:hypothetical protein
MPARSETIQIVPVKSGQPSCIMKFPYWWNRSAFFEKYRDRELDLGNPIDYNLAWLLSATEAKLWDEQCKKEFPDSEIDAHPDIFNDTGQLWDALRQASWVIVESREWESGLD